MLPVAPTQQGLGGINGDSRPGAADVSAIRSPPGLCHIHQAARGAQATPELQQEVILS
jgi:hypothetical protein